MMFTIETVPDHKITVFVLICNRFDVSKSGLFRQESEAAIPNPPLLLLDLAQVNFMDSTGLGSIIALHRTLKSAGGELRLCRPTRELKTLFDLMRLQRLISIHPTREEAIAAFPK